MNPATNVWKASSLAGRFVGRRIANMANIGSTFGKIATDRSTLRNPVVMKQMATDALKLYGTATAATWAGRVLSGRAPWKTKSGKTKVTPLF